MVLTFNDDLARLRCSLNNHVGPFQAFFILDVSESWVPQRASFTCTNQSKLSISYHMIDVVIEELLFWLIEFFALRPS